MSESRVGPQSFSEWKRRYAAQRKNFRHSLRQMEKRAEKAEAELAGCGALLKDILGLVPDLDGLDNDDAGAFAAIKVLAESSLAEKEPK